MLPLATTIIDVNRQTTSDPNAEIDLDSETDYSESTVPYSTIASGVRAVIAAPAGSRTFGPGGEREHENFPFKADPLPGTLTILGDDQIVDREGNIYRVLWTRERHALGMVFIEGECYQQLGDTD